MQAKEVHISLTVNSKVKTCKSYAVSDVIVMNEFVDFEVGIDASYMTVLLYIDRNEGQDWQGTADVNILSEVKGTNLDKSYTVELTKKDGKFLK